MRRLILITAFVAPLWCANTTVVGTLVTPTGDRPKRPSSLEGGRHL